MIVYHGSTLEVAAPEVRYSYRDLDFGRGFYVTTNKEQAVRWARRKNDLSRNGRAIVNEYSMNESIAGLRVHDFGDDMDEWIDFVCHCRAGGEDYRAYDLIKGKVADDRVFRVVDLYRNGVWDKARAIAEMKVYKTYDQIAFITQRAVDALLVFTKSYEV